MNEQLILAGLYAEASLFAGLCCALLLRAGISPRIRGLQRPGLFVSGLLITAAGYLLILQVSWGWALCLGAVASLALARLVTGRHTRIIPLGAFLVVAALVPGGALLQGRAYVASKRSETFDTAKTVAAHLKFQAVSLGNLAETTPDCSGADLCLLLDQAGSVVSSTPAGILPNGASYPTVSGLPTDGTPGIASLGSNGPFLLVSNAAGTTVAGTLLDGSYAPSKDVLASGRAFALVDGTGVIAAAGTAKEQAVLRSASVVAAASKNAIPNYVFADGTTPYALAESDVLGLHVVAVTRLLP